MPEGTFEMMLGPKPALSQGWGLVFFLFFHFVELVMIQSLSGCMGFVFPIGPLIHTKHRNEEQRMSQGCVRSLTEGQNN